eukprot:UN20907
MLLKKKFLCIEFKPKYMLRKASKLLFSNLKSTHSQLSLEKNQCRSYLSSFFK